MPHDPYKLIADIRLSIDEVDRFCANKQYGDFETDLLLLEPGLFLCIPVSQASSLPCSIATPTASAVPLAKEKGKRSKTHPAGQIFHH